MWKTSHFNVRMAIFAGLLHGNCAWLERVVTSNAGNFVFHSVRCMRKCDGMAGMGSFVKAQLVFEDDGNFGLSVARPA